MLRRSFRDYEYWKSEWVIDDRGRDDESAFPLTEGNTFQDVAKKQHLCNPLPKGNTVNNFAVR